MEKVLRKRRKEFATVDLVMSKLLMTFFQCGYKGLIYYLSIIRLLRLCFSTPTKAYAFNRLDRSVTPKGSLARLIHAPKNDTASTVRILEDTKVEGNVRGE